MKKFYWKVVNPDGTHFTSTCATGKAGVDYKVNRWTQPPDFLREKGYGLLVFKNRAAARNYDSGNYDDRVFKCKIKEILPLQPRCYLDDLKKGYLNTSPTPWPEGTVMVKQLKLCTQ